MNDPKAAPKYESILLRTLSTAQAAALRTAQASTLSSKIGRASCRERV